MSTIRLLQIVMQVHISGNVIKKIEVQYKIVLSTKYY